MGIRWISLFVPHSLKWNFYKSEKKYFDVAFNNEEHENKFFKELINGGVYKGELKKCVNDESFG